MSLITDLVVAVCTLLIYFGGIFALFLSCVMVTSLTYWNIKQGAA